MNQPGPEAVNMLARKLARQSAELLAGLQRLEAECRELRDMLEAQRARISDVEARLDQVY